MKSKKYSVNRFDRTDVADIEHQYFSNKQEAIKWAKRCKFFHVRLTQTRQTVATNF